MSSLKVKHKQLRKSYTALKSSMSWSRIEYKTIKNYVFMYLSRHACVYDITEWLGSNRLGRNMICKILLKAFFNFFWNHFNPI